MTRRWIGRACVALLAILPLTACDDLGLGGQDAVSLSFAVPRTGNGASAALLMDTISDGTHRIDVQSIDLTVGEIVLERAESEAGGDSDGDSDSDSDSEGSSNEKFRAGPTTISLPVAGGTITPITTGVPEGLYEKVEMDIDFVRVRGTYDGQAFDVTVPVRRELELEFDEGLEVTDDLNITVTINVLSWFRGADGKLIDPRALQTSTSLREQFINRISASIRAFEDSDKDADDSDSDSDSDRR